jgi:hypothetical protein
MSAISFSTVGSQTGHDGHGAVRTGFPPLKASLSATPDVLLKEIKGHPAMVAIVPAEVVANTCLRVNVVAIGLLFSWEYALLNPNEL